MGGAHRIWRVEKKVKLSIIVPVYNVAPYLRACLDSLVAASEKVISAEVEIICVDDGSTDGSAEILDDFRFQISDLRSRISDFGARRADFGARISNVKCQTSSFRVIHKQNEGVGAARNAALEVATGDWIGFVDADDTVSERWLEVAVGLIEATPSAEIVNLTPIVSVKDEHGLECLPKYEKLWIDRETAVEWARTAEVENVRVWEGVEAREVGFREYSRYGWPVANFVRRDFIGSVRFPVGIRLKEDVCFFVQLANRLTCWVEAEFPGYFYTRRDGSAVMRHRSDEDSLKFVCCMLELLRSGRESQISDFRSQISDFKSQMPGGKSQMSDSRFQRAVSTAIGYEFVQWAEERDPDLPYDAKNCPIRAAWRRAWNEGLIDLGDLPFFWRPAIRLWVWTGQLWLAKVTRRLREWTARFI